MNGWKHVYQRIDEHELSKTHSNSTEGYFFKTQMQLITWYFSIKNVYDKIKCRKKEKKNFGTNYGCCQVVTRSK